ncbi:MAG TPA: hypothetical protein VFA26_01425 [Gemmataceae bacterium]|nr:hypothetical protein [Gemmataceae bacterium]
MPDHEEPAPPGQPPEADRRRAAARLFRHARREAAVVLLVWAAALAWTVGYCYLRGYRHEPDSWPVRLGLAPAGEPPDLAAILGLPGWVFWGILLPWLVCTAFTFAFCLFGMTDDDLGTEQGNDDGA